MKTEPENIPNHLFDWLETRPFSTLSEAEKAEVLTFFSKEEFEEMQRVAFSIKGKMQPASPSGKERLKSQLLSRFDEIHAAHEAKERSIFASVRLWRAAAVVLLLICFGLTYKVFNKPAETRPEIVARVDTLYLVKEIAAAPVKLFDTVFISRTSPGPVKTVGLKPGPAQEVASDQTSFSSDKELAVVSLNELENTANQPKRNSMKDDSLLRKFAVVRL